MVRVAPHNSVARMGSQKADVLRYFRSSYAEEYDRLGDSGIGAVLERGLRWDFRGLLEKGGVLVFPHVHIADCGPYTGAVVNACLDSGADQVLAIGVLHAWTDEMVEARLIPEPEGHPLRGIYESGTDSRLGWPQEDHSLYGFTRLLGDAARLRGVAAPRLVTRYPFLTGSRPESLPGIEEVAALAKNSVVVSTADHCHHGIGYGHSAEEAEYYDEQGLAKIRGIIEDGLGLLDSGRYGEYIEHCGSVAKSDWRDAGPLVHHLWGPFKSTVEALIPSDFTNSFQQWPAPTWCAGALVSSRPVSSSRAI